MCPAGQASQAQKKKIIVGDDDELITAVLRHRLEKGGYEVVVASDGDEVVSLAEKGGVAAIVLDVKMPGRDGLDALRRLRALPATQHVPIAMLSGKGSESDIVKGIEMGADDYIVKPFSVLEVVARIRRLLKRTA